MTTTVKIEAHLSSDKEVAVSVVDSATPERKEEFVLQDGESAERYVYDGRTITVKEVLKSS